MTDKDNSLPSKSRLQGCVPEFSLRQACTGQTHTLQFMDVARETTVAPLMTDSI
jgi:hypothetical protein